MQPKQSHLKQLLIAIGAMALLPAMAQAQPDSGIEHCEMSASGHHSMPDSKFMDGPLPPFVHGLDLSEAQRDAMFNIMHNQAPLLRDKMKSWRKAEEALRALTMSSQFEEAKAKALAQEAADSMAVLALLRAQSEHQIYALLTPEQRKQAAELKNKADFRPTGNRAAQAAHQLHI